MKTVQDKLISKTLLHQHRIKLVTSDPESAKQGSLIINTVDKQLKIYFLGGWYTLKQLV